MGVFGNTFGNTVGAKGLVAPFYPWMELPYFALPENGVTILKNQEVTIYGDTLVNVPIENDLAVTFNCETGTVVGNNLVINEAIAGIYPCTMIFKNAGRIFDTKTINIKVEALTSAVEQKVLLIGASQMSSGSALYAAKINSLLPTVTTNFVGTQGGTIKHEAYSGKSWSWMITSVDSPFVKDGVLNIASYFIDNAIAVPDRIMFLLGTNDMFTQCNPANGGLSDNEITTIINNAKTLIDAFLAYNPDIEIIVGLLPICDNDGVTWGVSYTPQYSQDLWIEIVHKFSAVVVQTFANGVYNSRVDCSYQVIHMNRTNYNNNGVHPSDLGYTELGYGMAAKLNGKLNRIDELFNGENVVGDFDYELGVSKDLSGFVSGWEDQSSKLNHLLSSTHKPLSTADGILFDGVDDWLYTNPFAIPIPQPYMFYLVLKQITWTSGESLISGGDVSTNFIAVSQSGVSPQLVISAGSLVSNDPNLPLDTFGVIRATFDGASSKLIINDNTPSVGNPGNRPLIDLRVGRQRASVLYSNVLVKRIIIKKVADTQENSDYIYRKLKAKYGL